MEIKSKVQDSLIHKTIQVYECPYCGAYDKDKATMEDHLTGCGFNPNFPAKDCATCVFGVACAYGEFACICNEHIYDCGDYCKYYLRAESEEEE